MEIEHTAKNKNQVTLPVIHLTDIIIFFRKYIALFALVMALGGIFGILISFTITKTYTAKTILLPEYSSGKPSFFSLAMGSGADGIGTLTPDLYPNILESTSFGAFLLMQPVITQSGVKYTKLKEYLEKPGTPSLFSRIKSVFSEPKEGSSVSTKQKIQFQNADILNYSIQEAALVNGAKGLVKASIEQKNGLISIESEMTDPVVAAMLVEATKIYLINYVEDFRVAKLEEQLNFISKRATEARLRQQNAELALQSYRDHNRNAFLNVARIEEQRLQSDYTLAQSIYSDLILRQEQTKIKVKEERPVFKVLEPTKVPLDKTGPKRIIIAGVCTALGFLLTLLYTLFVREKIQKYFI